MHRHLFFVLFLLGFSVSAMAQTPEKYSHLDAFLESIHQASGLKSCSETENALKNISQETIEKAMHELHEIRDSRVALGYQERLQKISELSRHCPQIQDAFVNRISRTVLKSKLVSAADESVRTDAIQDLKAFALACYDAIDESDCQKSADHFKKISPELCKRAVLGFQRVDRSSLSTAEEAEIVHKLEHVMLYAQQCQAFDMQYQACLYPERQRETYLPLSQIEPFMRWLDGLKGHLERHGCQGSSEVIASYDSALRAEAQNVLKGIKPAQFSPEDRAQIRAKMKSVYQVLPDCVEARHGIDAVIESMF